MKKRPILFSVPMVKAILDGRKTMTRRIVKFKPRVEGLNLSWTGLTPGNYMTNVADSGIVLRARNGAGVWEDKTFPVHCPYGKPGDSLAVKETFFAHGFWVFDGTTKTGRTKLKFIDEGLKYTYAENPPEIFHTKPQTELTGWWKRPSLFCSYEISRINLENKNVRVERVQDISEEDAIAEGIEPLFTAKDIYHNGVYRAECDLKPMPYTNYLWETKLDGGSQFSSCATAKESFKSLWYLINGEKSWSENPFVWVIEFPKFEREDR